MAEAAEQIETKRDVVLQERHFKLAEQIRNRWSVVLRTGETKKDLLTPRYFAYVGAQIGRGDILEVRTEDELFYGEFIVLDCSRVSAKLQELCWIELGSTTLDISLDDEYEYAWKGPTWRHCVIRKSDGEPVAKELATKADALQWIVGRKRQQ